MPRAEQSIDALNAEFWDELCGSSLARALGITEVSPATLGRFDAAYLAKYPYLERYLPGAPDAGKSLLEIGLGFGTVGQLLARRGYRYVGVDIAPGPVAMMRSRLEWSEVDGEAQVASALELPFEAAAFDHVVSIGCLHHTGDLPGAVAEVARVLRRGGRALVMLYNSRSARQLLRLRPAAALDRLRGEDDASRARAAYDSNAAGDAAPHSEFVSRREVKRLFAEFSDVDVHCENIDALKLRGRELIARERLLGNLALVAGLDLYAVARR